MISEKQIEELVKVLNSGGIIIYPTATVWGLGCDATNAKAVKKIYSAKQREDSKALITLVSSIEMLEDFLIELDDDLKLKITEVKRPTTFIYPEVKGLAENAVAEDRSCAIRVTNHEICKQLIEAFGKPIISTSANLSGHPSPKTKDEISAQLVKQVDFILEAADPGSGIPSRIVKILGNNEFLIIRD